MTNLIAQVIAALLLVESGGDNAAIGDGGRAVGCLQLWPTAVAEANRLEGIAARREHRQARTWTVADRTNRAASVAMAEVTLAHHYRRGYTNAVALGCRWRNPYSECPAWYADKVRMALR